MDTNNPATRSRAMHIAAVVAMGVAVVAMFTSFRRTPEWTEPRPLVEHGSASSDTSFAPTYTDERERHHPNRLRHPTRFADMLLDRPALVDPVQLSPEDKRIALEKRLRIRAYAGAPPTIPHRVLVNEAPNCRTCHETGMKVGTSIAPAMSHGLYQNCLQCHAMGENPLPGARLTASVSEVNTFEGERGPESGERAWPGAPPTIPHATWMRSQCGACHGVLGTGIRSSHPWRQSCTQCHAPSAALDQRPETLPWNPK